MENAKTIPFCFNLELEDLRAQGGWNGWNTYMESYMAYKSKCFMVYQIVHEACLKEWVQHQTWDHNISKSQNAWFTMTYCVQGPTQLKMVMKMISVENPATYISTLNLKVKMHWYFWMGINWTDLPSFEMFNPSFLMVQSVVYGLYFCSGSLELVCSWTDHRFPE